MDSAGQTGVTGGDITDREPIRRSAACPRDRRAGRHTFLLKPHREVSAVRQEQRELMPGLIVRIGALDAGGRGHRTATGETHGRSAGQVAARRGSRRPCSTSLRPVRGARQDFRDTAVDVDPLQPRICEEPNGAAVGRPERHRRALGARQDFRRVRVERPQPQRTAALRMSRRRQSSVRPERRPARPAASWAASSARGESRTPVRRGAAQG